MKKRMTRALCAALCLLTALALTACAATPAPDVAVTDPVEVPTIVERDTVAVKIGEDLTITYGEISDYYNELLAMMSYYGSPAPTSDADIETYQDQVVDTLISQKKLLYFAAELGVDELNAEQQAELQASMDEVMEQNLSMFRESAEQEGAADPEARAKEIFDEELAAAGYGMTHEQYGEYVLRMLTEQKIIENLETHIRGTAEVSETDIQAYYDTLVAEQTAAYAEDASQYLADQEDFELGGGDPALVVPEGYLRIKLISVSPQGELDAAYAEKTAAMAALESEYGKLALEGGADNAARMEEIRAEYQTLKTDSEALYAAYIADAKAKIEEAKEKLDGGESFDAVLAAYGENELFLSSETIAANGCLMQLGGDDGFIEALHEAVDALEDGAYSEIIQSDDTYYIVCRVGEETPGTRTLDAFREAILEAALAAAGDTLWQQKQSVWEADSSMVVTYEAVYRSVGK